MKVTIEVDCTPLEARQFMGLPDVQPIQAIIASVRHANPSAIRIRGTNELLFARPIFVNFRPRVFNVHSLLERHQRGVVPPGN